MFKERCVQLIYLEEMLNKDVYLMCHNRQSASAMIDGTMINVFREIIRFSKRRDEAAIIIQTPGGYADEAIYICKFFREYYDVIDTYIVGDCYSGGTIIALSSDNIFMSRNACLGPIDVQISYDDKNPWEPELYGMVTALEKSLKDKNSDHSELAKVLKSNPGVLATYLKLKYNYKNLVGDYVTKHCKDEETGEKVWEYLAELNFSHGSSLTYKRCVELGLDVKRMPKEIDGIVSKIVRDIDEEFGGLVSKSILCDIYEAPDGNVIKTKEISDEKTKFEISLNKSTEKLAIIETSQAGYFQECEIAVTMYGGFIPMYITPIKRGWREEYNTILVLPEQNQIFEAYIDESVREYLEQINVVPESIPSNAYQRIRNFFKKTCYDSVLEALKESGEEVDAMSSGEKWKAVVEYCLEAQKKIYEDQMSEYSQILNKVIKKDSLEFGVDYESLTNEEKEDFIEEIFNRRIPKVIELLGVSDEEFMELSNEEQYHLVIEYMITYESLLDKGDDTDITKNSRGGVH